MANIALYRIDFALFALASLAVCARALIGSGKNKVDGGGRVK